MRSMHDYTNALKAFYGNAYFESAYSYKAK